MGLLSRLASFRVVSLSVAILGVLGVPAVAFAQPKSSDAKAVESARSQFYRALALQDQGKWAEALELLETVAEMRESAQVRFNIAFNQEHLGRLAVAARGYERAIRLAEQSGARNVISAANERLARLSSRIARLVLRPAGEGMVMAIDGVELAVDEQGRALPVEVGNHTIQAQAAGQKPYRASVLLSAGEVREIVVALEPLGDARPPEPAPAGQLQKPREPSPRKAPATPHRGQESKPSTLPYIAAGAAVLSIATAGVFYALRKDALDTMRASCDDGRCPDELRSTDELGSMYTTAANVALATGIGLGGVSAGLFISEIDDGGDEKRALGVRASVSTSF